MINYYNYIYLGKIYMGSGPVKQEIVTNFDTGSDWLVVEIDQCNTCHGNTYDTSQSYTYRRNERGRETTMDYSSLFLEGFEAFDTVCFLRKDMCVDSFKWFAITY